MNPATPHPPAPAAHDESEWVGGRVDLPALQQIDPDATPKAAILWIEAASCKLLGSHFFDATDSPPVAGSLRDTMKHPREGRPRRPKTVRVADAGLAPDIQAALGKSARVVIGPTPEVDNFAGLMMQVCHDLETAAAVPTSYLADGALSADTIGGLFLAAGDLYETAPWEGLDDASILRLDIPAYDVHGAVVSILGAAGEVTGFAIFPGLAAYEHFADAVQGRLAGQSPGRPDHEPKIRQLTFDPEDEVPESLQREVEAHDWVLPENGIYPAFDVYTQAGELHPMTEDDARVLWACAEALDAFFRAEPRCVEATWVIPASAGLTLTGQLQVEITYPYEAYGEFVHGAPDIPVQRPPIPGRNERCPCGSGRKFKHCHLGRETELPGSASTGAVAVAPASEIPQPPERGILDMDVMLVERILNDTGRWAGAAWDRLLEEVTTDHDMFTALISRWASYHAQVKGRSVLDCFEREHHSALAPREREWLKAQRGAWLTVWSVEDSNPGRELYVHDLFSGESREVSDAVRSRILRGGDAVLARVVDYKGSAYFSGIHPVILDAEAGTGVANEALKRLQEKPPVAPQDLAPFAFGRQLIRDWQDAADEFQ